MHIILDIRNDNLHDIWREDYAHVWANMWMGIKKDDKISFLIYDHQQKRDDRYIVAPREWLGFGKKPIVLSGHHEAVRCLNFSPFIPYDPKIPTISHVWDNAQWLYPRTSELSYWQRKKIEFTLRRVVRTATTLVVPNIQTGTELVELWHADEENIEIIPYIPPPHQIGDTNVLTQFHFPKEYFIYDGGYGGEASLVDVLKAFEVYRHRLGGTHSLLLLGYAGDEFSHIAQIIRAFDLTESVQYIGPVDITALHTLYRDASGWIYLGSYYGGGPAIALAISYNLPLLLSDIRPFDHYHGIKVHPNHLEGLPMLFQKLESYQEERSHPSAEIDTETYIRVYEKILAKGKKKK